MPISRGTWLWLCLTCAGAADKSESRSCDARCCENCGKKAKVWLLPLPAWGVMPKGKESH